MPTTRLTRVPTGVRRSACGALARSAARLGGFGVTTTKVVPGAARPRARRPMSATTTALTRAELVRPIARIRVARLPSWLTLTPHLMPGGTVHLMPPAPVYHLRPFAAPEVYPAIRTL